MQQKKYFSAKAKILFVGAIPPPYHGGTIINKILLESELSKEFNLIHLDTSDRRDLTNLGKIDLINILYGIKHLVLLCIYLRKYKPELLYITAAQNKAAFFRDGLFIIFSKLFASPKVVVHFRGSNYLNFYKAQNKTFRKFIEVTFRKCDFGIVLGNNLVSMIITWFDKKEILVIPEGSDFLLNEQCEKIPHNIINIGYIGILCEAKGTKDLIAAFSILKKKYNNIKLILAGEFGYNSKSFKSEIISIIQKESLTDSVELLGNVSGEKKENFFRSLDIFVFPSYSEGHPISIIEAMASAIPIIASNVGAIPECIFEGENGFLIEPGNIENMVDKIDELIQREYMREKMSAKTRELYLSNFTSKTNIKNIASAFHKVLNS